MDLQAIKYPPLCAACVRFAQTFTRTFDKPARTRRHRVPAPAARTIAELLTVRDQVIAPILAGIRSPRMGRKPKPWTSIDRDYEQIRVNMQTLFDGLALTTPAPPAA